MIEFFRRVFVFLTHYLRTLSFLYKVANILLDLLNFLNFAISDLKKKWSFVSFTPFTLQAEALWSSKKSSGGETSVPLLVCRVPLE